MLVFVGVVVGIAAGVGGTLLVLRRLATSGLEAARRTRALLLEEA
jgi:ABC-type Mn2+/Zn2+ transport system permease subunit